MLPPLFSGFYCTLLATEPAPTDGVTGNICPRGNYCPEGSDTPTPCPTGTYLDAEQSSNVTECLDCPLGEFSYKLKYGI